MKYKLKMFVIFIAEQDFQQNIKVRLKEIIHFIKWEILPIMLSQGIYI